MALRNRINWAIAATAETPSLFMLSPFGVLQPVDSRGIDMGDGSLLNPKQLNGRQATYRKMTEGPGWLLGCGPKDNDTDIDLYPPITIVRGLFGEGPDTVCEGDDYRLSNARYPEPHADSHYITGADHIIPNMIGAVDLTDERLTDKREPRLHAETHWASGEDRLVPFQIGAAAIDHRHPIATNEIRGHVQPDGYSIKVTPQGVISADPQHIDASKITSGTIDFMRLPKVAINDIKIVTNDEKRFELTTKEVQNGDTVKVNSSGIMYFVVDDTKLNSPDGYLEYTAYESAFVDWDGVKDKPYEFNPRKHAYDHSTGGSDTISPESIAAADRVHTHQVSEVIGAVADNDPRLSDARTPVEHIHTVDEVTGGVADTDPRLTDARTPLAHADTHAKGATDEITLDSLGAASIDDPRFTDKRDPNVHAVTHAADGTDPITPASIGAVATDDPRLTITHTPNPHSASHATGGADAITPESISAANAVHTHVTADITDAVTTHATAHAINGTDCVTPLAIGATPINYRGYARIAAKGPAIVTTDTWTESDAMYNGEYDLVGQKFIARAVPKFIDTELVNVLDGRVLATIDKENGRVTIKESGYYRIKALYSFYYWQRYVDLTWKPCFFAPTYGRRAPSFDLISEWFPQKTSDEVYTTHTPNPADPDPIYTVDINGIPCNSRYSFINTLWSVPKLAYVWHNRLDKYALPAGSSVSEIELPPSPVLVGDAVSYLEAGRTYNTDLCYLDRSNGYLSWIEMDTKKLCCKNTVRVPFECDGFVYNFELEYLG